MEDHVGARRDRGLRAGRRVAGDRGDREAAPPASAGAARSNSVRPVIGWSPSLPSCARRAAILRPRNPPPPRIETFMPCLLSLPDARLHRPRSGPPSGRCLAACPSACSPTRASARPAIVVLPGRRLPAREGGDHRLERLCSRRRCAICRRWPAGRPWRDAAEGRSGPLRPGQLQGARRRLCGRRRAGSRAGPARRRARRSSADLVGGRYRGDRAITVTCATDGNHGRAVAWGAQRFHCRCVIFVHDERQPGPGGRDRRAMARRCAACRAPMTTRCARRPGRRRRKAGSSSPTRPGPATPRCRGRSCRATG